MIDIDTKELKTWLAIPYKELPVHPKRKMDVVITEKASDANLKFARMMADEVIKNNKEGKPSRWVLACGPFAPVEEFVKIVNLEDINLKDVHIFHMDEWCDWKGIPISVDNYWSMEGQMRRDFYGKIKSSINIPEKQRHFPNLNNLEAYETEISRLGGLDTIWGGLGMCGHIAFNEPPKWKYSAISLEEFMDAGMHIVPLNEDTIINAGYRNKGSCMFAVPPMGITIGFKEMMKAERAVLLSTSGAWKHTIMRIALFSKPTIDFPGTILQLMNTRPLIITDKNTIQSVDWK